MLFDLDSVIPSTVVVDIDSFEDFEPPKPASEPSDDDGSIEDSIQTDNDAEPTELTHEQAKINRFRRYVAEIRDQK